MSVTTSTARHCGTCGRPRDVLYVNGQLVSEEPCQCALPPAVSIPGLPLMGWRCPNCGAGCAPSLSVCPCVNPQLASFGMRGQP
jgi:hypothetical protein